MKMKTKKIVARRFKITKSGKILHRRQYGRHLRAVKSKWQIRRYKTSTRVTLSQEKMLKTFLPYS
jgi:large subunit ribosomal protein L35